LKAGSLISARFKPAQGTPQASSARIPFEDLLVQPVVSIGTQPNPAAFSPHQ